MDTVDAFDLKRFLDAQAGVYETALGELVAGRKRSHWMWFIFPQLRALGRSPTAQFYGIGSLAEAKAYVDHPVLGSRLRQCTQALLGVQGRSIGDILGAPDDMKFRSSMTLFARAKGDDLFDRALRRFYDRPDDLTLNLLSGSSEAQPGS